MAREKGYFKLDCGLEIPILGASSLDANDPLMPIQKGKIGHQEVNVLRDTGCNGAVVDEKFVHASQFTGEHRICTFMDRTLIMKYPVVQIEVDTPFYLGKVLAVAMKTPIFDLVLGNNIPGVKEPFFSTTSKSVRDSFLHNFKICQG
ncbi:hypothetical protein HOLleu_12040 [Holothuria leucospilota]|uniref:Uncharacterized protein n=1 Tax=Holothuria leucospilota TaxID=206669 RepID=A0A9Q1CB07_HOLLE|nr:hypothetical protein HOLleu_12040 [Holothuria leucospilota]